MIDDTELRLAIAACRAAFSEGLAGDAEPLARTVNWDRFIKVASRHRVQALCWHGLMPVNHIMPVGAVETLRLQARAILEANLRIAAESARLFALFQSAGLQLLFLKGLTLGALAYPSPFLKMGWDIDLLVAREQLSDAAGLIQSAGYTSAIPANGRELESWHRARKESVWRHAEGGFHIDLHTRLADNPALLPKVGVNSPSRMIAIAKGIQLPTLGKDELFAYLTVHGASSAWFRLKWITDFVALLQYENAKEIERLYDRSQQLGAGGAAAQALLLADRLYGTAIGSALRDRLNADAANRRLVRLAEQQLGVLREPTARFLGTAAIHYSQLFLLPGWRFKAAEVARQLRDAIAR